MLVWGIASAVSPTGAHAMELMTESRNVFSEPSHGLYETAFRQAGHAGASKIRALVLNETGFSWASTDAFVDAARARDFDPYLTLTYKPIDWGDAGRTLAMPADQTAFVERFLPEFSSFCRTAAQRYGDRVAHYSVWNEPNHFQLPDGVGGQRTVPAARYGQLYRACQREITAADSNSKVYFGELATGSTACSYLAAALGSTTVTDGVAIHPYQWQEAPDRAVRDRPCSGIGRLADWRAAIDAQSRLQKPGGGAVPLLVTEFGYCVQGGACPEGPHTRTETERATWLTGAFAQAQAANVVLFSYYHLVKGTSATAWDTGIVNTDGTPTPSVQALRTATRTQSPTADTQSASDVGETVAQLNGTVNPNGIRTRYRFEYGRTTDYGSSMPAAPGADLGAGTSAVTVTNAIGGLEAGKTYHYRLVAESRAGRTEGADLTFRTRDPRPAFARPAVLTDTTNGRQEVYYFRADGTVARWAFDGRAWTNRALGTGVQPARRNTSPAVIRGASDDQRELYYVGTDGIVYQWFFNGRQWFHDDLGSPGATAMPDTSPVVVRGPGVNQREVYYTGVDGQIKQWFYNGSGTWFNGPLSLSPGTPAAAGTSPSVTRDPVTGQEELYYVGNDGQIKQWFYNGRGTWFNGPLPSLGDAAAPNASPVVVRGPASNQREIYYLGADGQVKQWFANGAGGWFNGNLRPEGGAPAAPDGEPFQLQGPGAGQEEVYYSGADGRIMQWFYNGVDTWFNGDLRAPAPPVHPGASPAAVKGIGGQEFLYYLGEDGQLHQWFYNGSGSWFNAPLVESAPTAPYTGPVAVKGPGAGQEEVYAFDDDGTLRQWFFNGTSWNDAPIGIPATATRGARGARPFAIAGPGEGQEEIYYVGIDGQIHQWFYDGRGTWFNSPLSLTPGMAAAFGTSPYVVRGPGEGQREVYYVGVDGQVHQWFFNGRDPWFNGPLSPSPGAIAAPATSPVVTRDPATGQEELYYVGADGQIKQWFYNGRGTWTNGGFGVLGAAAAAGASPVVLRAPGDNQREVYYVGADGFVKQWFQNGTGRWTNGGLGAPGAAVADGTSPVVLRPAGSPDRRELYYAGTDGQIKRWTTDGGGRWSNGGLGVTGPAVTPGTSPFVLQAPGETQREVYYVGLDGRVKQWFYNGVDTWFNTPL